MTTDPCESWQPQKVTVIGPGLLGGSFALAVQREWPDAQVIGCARAQTTLDSACDLGVIHSGVTDLEEACDQSDLVCVATPVDWIAEHVCLAAKHVREGALITDVGSTKATIVESVERNRNAYLSFVASHPIAGGEKSGSEYATADLFVRRTVVVTPTARTDSGLLERTNELWRRFGAGAVLTTTPADHDRFLAATSHLPHLAASALASLLTHDAAPFVGPGWSDTTRVAGGSVEMWSAICRHNREPIGQALDQLLAQLTRLRDAMDSEDFSSLSEILETARSRRELIAGHED